jgi:hypothetical protein
MSKKIIAILAAALMMAAFFMPMTAYATEDRSALYEQYDMDSMTLEELLEIFTMTEILNYYSVFNTTDNDPDASEPPAETEPPEPPDTAEPLNETAVPGNGGKPFTPDGQATVVDLAYESDGKMFYTFKTPAGNVFYLIIDRERSGDNVYFLNAVTEQDLIALTDGAVSTGNNGSTSAIPTDPSTSEPGTTENPGETPAGKDEPAKKGGVNTGMIIFLLIGAAVLGGAGYYIKIVRPKQQRDMDDDEDEGLDRNDDGGEMQFEDEQPEDADGGESEDTDTDE